MSHLRRARLRDRFTTDHERARRLAAERLTEPLAPPDRRWLAAHLAGCPECAAVATGYERDTLALRAAREATPLMPRDLWARTAAALDAEERRAAGGRRSAASAAGARRGPASLATYGVLAAAVVVAVVVGSTLLSTGSPIAPTIATPLPSVAAVPSPVPVEAANVAWFAPQDDGTYALNIAAVPDVCPAGAEGCAPVDGSSRQQLRLTAAPRAVLRSPAGSQLAVLDAATKTVGGTIYMVRLPPPQGAATIAPSASPTIIPIASAPPSPTAAPSDVVTSDVLPSSSPGETAAASPPLKSLAAPSESPSASSSPSPSASATDGSAFAIATGIVVVGETMGYSSDGSWLAFTARSADGSTGTDIWVWHVGEPVAWPVTSDHRSVFASWLGDLILGSRAAPEASAGTTDGTTAPSSTGGTPGGSLAPGATEPAPTPEPTASPGPTLEPTSLGPTGSSDAAGVAGAAGASPADLPSPVAVPSPVGPVATPISFLLDPASGGRADLALPGWRPVVDPSGRWVVYWSGRLTLDPATVSWVPLDGGFAIAPWAVFAGIASSDGTFVLPPLPTLPALSDGTAASDGTVGSSALPSEPDAGPATASPTLVQPAASAAIASPAEESPEASATASPDTSGSEPLSPSPTPFPLLVEPEPLPGISADNGLGALPTDWDVRWDPSGDHLAIWVGDPVDLRLGRLSLLAVDPPTGRVDLDNSLLRDEPALGGISLDEGRLAWATPPGQDGQGSRLQILGWGDAGSGQLDGQPVNGQETVVVVR